MILDQYPELLTLSQTQKLQLAEELYSLVFAGKPQRSDEEVYAELERSMTEYRRDPETASTWEQLKARVLASRNA